jgi:hypothetical protein
VNDKAKLSARIVLALTVLAAGAGAPASALADNLPQPTITIKTPAGTPTPRPDAAPSARVRSATQAPVIVPTPAPRVARAAAPTPRVTTPAAKVHVPVKKRQPAHRKRHVVKKPHRAPGLGGQHLTRTVTVTAPAAPAVAPTKTTPAAQKGGSSSATTIGIFVGAAVLLLLILLVVAKMTRAALGAAPEAPIRPVGAPAPTPKAYVPAAPIYVAANDVHPDSIRADALPVPASTHRVAAPTADTLMITVWRGYGKSRFVARFGTTGPVVAASKPFRWRADKAQQPEAAVRAHTELLAKLSQAGWRSASYSESDPWYRVDLRQVSATGVSQTDESADELSAPLPAPP